MDQLARFPFTVSLIAVTVLITLIAWSDKKIEDRYIFHVHPIKAHKDYIRLISSGFLHSGPLHLLLNMYVLWLFGRYLEFRIGPVGYLFVYFAALIGGSLWSLMENHRNPLYRALGASGAVSGVVIAFCMFEPFTMLSFFFIPMPALVFAVLYIGISAYLSTNHPGLGNIGHDAHLGGALVGGVATVLVDFSAWTTMVSSISSLFGG